METIAISGFATVGKDAFCRVLIQEFQKDGINANRFALADELKAKVRKPLLELCDIDVLSCSAQEKAIIRDYLVAVGKIKRLQTNGTYWTGLLENKIVDSIGGYGNQVAIITDIRYDVFPEDEISWVKNRMRGQVVHLSRYRLINGSELFDYQHNPYLKQGDRAGQWRLFVGPPNEDERANDPKIQAKADYLCEWETFREKGENEDADDYQKLLDEHCRPYVQAFLFEMRRIHKLKL